MKRLICGCCGESALGKQHWNHDTGFGLCAHCVYHFLERGERCADELKGYGNPGVNWAVPLTRDCQPGMLVSWKTVGDDRPHVGTLKEWDNGTAIIREHLRWLTGEDDKNTAVRA